jgi:hypothetical protein
MSVLTSFICRVLFVGAFVLAGVAVWEKLANFVGYTVLRGQYAPGRLLEFAAVALLFVAALLLREIRTLLKRTTP